MYMISENDEDATNLLFTKYRPIIIKLANKYYQSIKNNGVELDDLIQEGYCALFEAIKRFDKSKDILFYTYAVLCINSKMHNFILTSNTYKNKALNDSVSIYENVGDTNTLLIDILGDKKALLPDIEIENRELYSEIKKILYNANFEDSIVFELKLNGFSNKDIAMLLNKRLGKVYSIIKDLKKNLLILIEKNNL